MGRLTLTIMVLLALFLAGACLYFVPIAEQVVENQNRIMEQQQAVIDHGVIILKSQPNGVQLPNGLPRGGDDGL